MTVSTFPQHFSGHCRNVGGEAAPSRTFGKRRGELNPAITIGLYALSAARLPVHHVAWRHHPHVASGSTHKAMRDVLAPVLNFIEP
ncbi:MAG: hypothetical protein IBJ03_06410 [Gemmatimonadaceae bacterium]|nr:hypothetical protein [Gemmatimonadaceae bacterium]